MGLLGVVGVSLGLLAAAPEGRAGVCALRMEVPADVDTYVEGRLILSGPGGIEQPCNEPIWWNVEIRKGPIRLKKTRVRLRPGGPSRVIALDPAAPALPARAASEPTDELELPTWWEASLRGHPLGRPLSGAQRRVAQALAGCFTVGAGCGVWAVYAAAVAVLVAVAVAVVVVLVAAVMVLVAAVAALLGAACGGSPAAISTAYDCGDLTCGALDCGSGCVPVPVGEGMDSPLVYPVWLGYRLVARGNGAMVASMDRGDDEADAPAAEGAAVRY